MITKRWSEKDLINKWVRTVPASLEASLPWDILRSLVNSLSSDTCLPTSSLLAIIDSRDVGGLIELSSNLDVTVYTSADLLLQDRLVLDLFSKFDFANSPFNKREKAELRFAEAEVMCLETNTRLSNPDPFLNETNSIIHGAKRIIERTLGGFDVNEMLTFSRFGPGSTLCVKGAFTTEYFKLCEKLPSVSTSAFPYAEALLDHDLKWRAYLYGVHPMDVAGPFSPIDGLGVELLISDYNKVAFVPKNAKTERSIAIEPYFNVYFQLGVGGMIRKRLHSHCGINLDSQERNQLLALKGSITDELATIDFTMASDTLSRATVEELIPPVWFQHLDRLRSTSYVMGDRKVSHYHKFSSMGNGFTFELETLIFFAVAAACCDHLGISTEDLSVYGDDVILPSQASLLFVKTCAYLGFKSNDEKSFLSGPFRESCGEDYLKGIPVRPVFCKELRTVQDLVKLANRLFELNRSVGFGSRLNAGLDHTVALLHSHVPRDVREIVVGPPSSDYDGYIHTECPSIIAGSPLVRWDRSLYCWRTPTIRFRPKEFTRRDAACALFVSWSLSTKVKPISRSPTDHATLCRIFGHGTFDVNSLIAKTEPRTITGRKIGSYTLGQSLVWSLG